LAHSVTSSTATLPLESAWIFIMMIIITVQLSTFISNSRQ